MARAPRPWVASIALILPREVNRWVVVLGCPGQSVAGDDRASVSGLI